MSEVEKKQIELKLYGLAHEGGHVRADVFIKKMDKLIKGLRSADQKSSGQKTLEYLITDLVHSSAHAKMSEFQYNTSRVPVASAINEFVDVLISVKDGEGIPMDTPEPLARAVKDLGQGCDKLFSHGEVLISGEHNRAVMVDKFFEKRASRAFQEFSASEKVTKLFSGVALETFDGELKEVDLRGTVARAKLVLELGGKELDCTCNSVTVENLREALDQRVSVQVRAHYNGIDRLPEQIEIISIQQLGEVGSLRKWRGQFDLDYPRSEDVW